VDTRPIGVFDSGIGGLSVLREIRRQLPSEDVLYLADQGHVPYGPRSVEEIRRFVAGITRFFLERDVKVIVIACNTASAASLRYVREVFPEITFVGMEPAVKPAAENTQSGVIGVIATQVTSQGELFASVVDRYASNVEVVTQVCPDFVTLVEAGDLESERVRQTAEGYLEPLRKAEVDQLVLACTHFSFLIPVLQDAIGSQVAIVDPGPAVARQTGRVIEELANASGHSGEVFYFTTGDPEAFFDLAKRLMDEPVDRGQVHPLIWHDDRVLHPA
jgi:glutamate racemase